MTRKTIVLIHVLPRIGGIDFERRADGGHGAAGRHRTVSHACRGGSAAWTGSAAANDCSGGSNLDVATGTAMARFPGRRCYPGGALAGPAYTSAASPTATNTANAIPNPPRNAARDLLFLMNLRLLTPQLLSSAADARFDPA